MKIFFEPESVAVIGAPRKSGPDTYNGVEIMIRYGYRGRIYPVNPKAGEICGLKAYPSVEAIPETLDLAIISTSRDQVIPIFEKCLRSGVRRVIVVSQGFADADERGKKLQGEIARLKRNSPIRVLGPNTLGVINNFRNFSTGFLDLGLPRKVPPVSLIAQTGMIQVASENLSYHAWGKAIDVGNASDVDFVDALEYFGNDPETKVIALHIEGIVRGRELLKAASQISLRKPIIVLKTGRTSAGARAALSHTGSLVGEDEICEAAFRRAGMIRVKNGSELKDAVRSFLLFEDMQGPRLGVLTPTGAGGIMATDACEDYGLKIGELPEGLAGKLKNGVPDWIQIGNPIDIWPPSMLGRGYPSACKTALTEMLKSPKIDGILVLTVSLDSPLHQETDIVETVAAVRRETGSRKPIALWVYGWNTGAVENAFESAADNVACFDSIERAVQGLSFRYCYNRIRNREISSPRGFSYESEKAGPLLQIGRERKILLGQDALMLLSAFGIPVVRGKIARNWNEIETAAGVLHYPLVLKLYGEAFLHKSEWEGVMSGIRNKKDLRQAFQQMKKAVSKRDPALKVLFQVQEMAKGKELLVGLKFDAQFGHVLACGFGGVYTEVFRDISRELVPVGRPEAEKMLSSLKINPILTGVRGEKGVDREGVLDVLERLSFLAAKVPDIIELDINPLMADASGCVAVDARILW